MELLSLVLTIRPTSQPDPERPLPRWWGRAAHALLLRVLSDQDPGLTERIHSADGLRPFTVSNLMGRFPDRKLGLEENYRLRFSAVSAEVSSLLHTAAQDGALSPGKKIELDFCSFQVQGAAWETASPETASAEMGTAAWAGSTNYQDLATDHLISSTSPQKRISLQFTSPTAFRSQERVMPLPLPGLVFGSLVNRWNAFAPLALPEEVKRYADECLAISRFNLRSRVASLKDGGQRVGAVGAVTYTTLNYDCYWMGIMHALAAFTLYAGVGVSTSMGMGQCRMV